jgi:hypothetical protein
LNGLGAALVAASRSLPMDGGWTTDVRLNDDGSQIVSLAADGASWWATETGSLLRHMTASSKETTIRFCGDSGLIVDHPSWPNNDPQRSFRFTDIATGEVWGTIQSDAARSVADCSRDRKWAVLDHGGEYHLWDLARQEDLGPSSLPPSATTPRFSADTTRLVSGGGIVEIPSRRLIARLDNPVKLESSFLLRFSRSFQLVNISADSRLIVAASDLGNVAVWRSSDGVLQNSFVVTTPRYGRKPLADLETLHKAIVSIAISPDAKSIAVADIDSRISIWSSEAGATRPLQTLNVLADEDAPARFRITTDDHGQTMFGAVTRVRFFDAATLVFMTETGRVSIRAVDTLQKIRAMQDPEYFATSGDAATANIQPGFVFDQRGRQLVTFGCFAGLRRWSFSTDGFGGRFKDLSELFSRDSDLPQQAVAAAAAADPAVNVRRACSMLRASDQATAAAWCAAQ